MKTTIKLLFVIAGIIYLILAYSCTHQKELVQKYNEWVVIEKDFEFGFGDNYFMLIITNGDSVKTIKTYKYYYELYKTGDTIK